MKVKLVGLLLCVCMMSASLGTVFAGAAGVVGKKTAASAAAAQETAGPVKPLRYTPAGFVEKTYRSLSAKRKTDMAEDLRDYWNKQRITNSTKKSYYDVFLTCDVVNMEEYPKSEYGLEIYMKDRGEQARKVDVQKIKLTMDTFTGLGCRVRIIPGKYSYNELAAVQKELDAGISPHGAVSKIEKGKIVVTKANDEVRDIVTAFAAREGCADYITVV